MGPCCPLNRAVGLAHRPKLAHLTPDQCLSEHLWTVMLTYCWSTFIYCLIYCFSLTFIPLSCMCLATIILCDFIIYYITSQSFGHAYIIDDCIFFSPNVRIIEKWSNYKIIQKSMPYMITTNVNQYYFTSLNSVLFLIFIFSFNFFYFY